MFKKYPRFTIDFSLKEFKALLKSFLKGNVIKGQETKLFEDACAEYLNAKYAIAVCSGRSAFYYVLKSLNFPKGSEIIVPAYTHYIVPAIIKYFGHKPIFVDVKDDTLNIDSSLISEKITDRTKAIAPTHMYGQPAQMDEILAIAKKHNLIVIEDATHAFGAKYNGKNAGILGDVSFFSFYTKSPNCFGGGLIVTNNQSIYQKAQDKIAALSVMKSSKFIMWFIKSVILTTGSNIHIFTFMIYPLMLLLNKINANLIDDFFEEKIDSLPEGFEKGFDKFLNLQAILGLEQLKKIEQNNHKRIHNAEYIIERIKDRANLKLTFPIPGIVHIHLYLYIRVTNKEGLRKFLFRNGIDSRGDCFQHCPDLGIFTDHSAYPVSSTIIQHNILIPSYPRLEKKDLDRISDVVIRGVA